MKSPKVWIPVAGIAALAAILATCGKDEELQIPDLYKHPTEWDESQAATLAGVVLFSGPDPIPNRQQDCTRSGLFYTVRAIIARMNRSTPSASPNRTTKPTFSLGCQGPSLRTLAM